MIFGSGGGLVYSGSKDGRFARHRTAGPRRAPIVKQRLYGGNGATSGRFAGAAPGVESGALRYYRDLQ